MSTMSARAWPQLPSEVIALSKLPDPALPWAIPYDAVRLIAEAEGLRLRAYRCPAGVPSIGYGETRGVRMGDTCTKEQADGWLCDDIAARARAVRTLTRAQEPTPAELGAMVSLAYNIGIAAFQKSTVLRQHNAGNRQAAARAFGLWNKARVNGVLTELAGLTARRAREAAMYLDGDEDQAAPMPQAVQAESSMSSSPIARAGAVTAGAGGLVAVLGPLGEHLASVRDFAATLKGLMVDTLGVPADWILPLLLIGAGLVIVRYRYLQRREGWA